MPIEEEFARAGEDLWNLRLHALPEQANGKIVWRALASDMNADGAVTISDAWLWLGWLFSLPGDMALIAAIRLTPSVGQFLELGPHSLSGGWSVFLSALIWVTACVTYWTVQDASAGNPVAAQRVALVILGFLLLIGLWAYAPT